MLEIPVGESLQDHQVHERAWVTVIDGELEITATTGESVAGGTGLMVEFAPGERHAVSALTTPRLSLLLAPWPGEEHPGAMSLSDKATVRQRATAHRASHTVAGTGSAVGQRGRAAPLVQPSTDAEGQRT